MAGVDAALISSHLRELQQEKKKLENKLEHLQMRKKDLETKQDSVERKNLLLNQKNENMKRTVNVGKMKVQETQVNVDRLQRTSDDLQKEVACVKSQIASHEKHREEQIEGFQQKYDELAECFRNARKYYQSPVLKAEELRWSDAIQHKKKQLCQNHEMVSEISQHLDKLKMVEDSIPEEKPAKSIWRQYLDLESNVLNLFESQKESVQSVVNELSCSNQQHENSLSDVLADTNQTSLR